MIKKRILLVAVIIATLGFAFSVVMVSTSRSMSSPAANVTVVTQQIQALQHLVTREYHYRDVVYFSEVPRILGIPINPREILFHATIVVTAGVDLSQGLRVEPVRGQRNAVSVVMPTAEIMHVDMNEHSIHQHFVRDSRGRLDWVHVSQAVMEARERNRADAITRGILREAERHAEVLIRQSLSAGDITVAEVVFQ